MGEGKERRQGREGRGGDVEGGRRRAEETQRKIMSKREQPACLKMSCVATSAEMYTSPGLFTDWVLDPSKREDFKKGPQDSGAKLNKRLVYTAEVR